MSSRRVRWAVLLAIAVAVSAVLVTRWVPIKYYVVSRPFIDDAVYGVRDFWQETRRDRPRCAASAPSDRPSVIVIAVDTLRADRLEAYGYRSGRTPHLRDLARDSLVFERAYSAAPWTTPAFAGMLSGEHPGALGISQSAVRLSESVPTLATLLCDAGYATYAIVSHTYLGRQYGFARGFERWSQTNARGPRYVSSEKVTDAAIARLDALSGSGRPFLLLVHYFDPHSSFLEHPGFEFTDGYDGPLRRDGKPVTNDRLLRALGAAGYLDQPDYDYLSALYDSEVAFTDHHVGRLLQALEARGMYEEALIVFAADHGEMLGERAPNRPIGHTSTLYDELIRVPFMIKLPQLARIGREPAPVSTVDLVPTVLDLLDLDAAPALERDRSLVRDDTGKRAVFSQTRRTGRLDSIVSGRWKLVRDADTGERALYDLEVDPGEDRDAASRFPEVARDLAARLDAWLESLERRAEALGSPSAVALSEAEARQLEALGYVDP